jgi:hypothetical protein
LLKGSLEQANDWGWVIVIRWKGKFVKGKKGLAAKIGFPDCKI